MREASDPSSPAPMEETERGKCGAIVEEGGRRRLQKRCPDMRRERGSGWGNGNRRFLLPPPPPPITTTQGRPPPSSKTHGGAPPTCVKRKPVAVYLIREGGGLEKRLLELGGDLDGPALLNRVTAQVASGGVDQDQPSAGAVAAAQQKQINKKRGRGAPPDQDEDEGGDDPHKPTRKRLRNRIKAQKSSERKKVYLSELESKVKDLEKKNLELKGRCMPHSAE